MYLRFYLQTQHNIARRKFTSLIDQGKIMLNGKKVDSYKQEIGESDDLQIIGEKTIQEKMKKSEEITSQIVLFNKPIGYVVSKSDIHNKTIYTILPKEFHSFYYIGRLDKDSRGLLLLTNNPGVVHEFEHPKKVIEKEYRVILNNTIEMADIEQMIRGIKDEDDILRAKKVTKEGGKKISIILTEGKNRHIRRMCKALGYAVLDLQRVREGTYTLGTLKEGEWKIV